LSAFLDRREIDALPRKAICEWSICNHDLICQRYNRIAALIPFFEYALFMPSGLRKRAVDQLKLRRGDRVLEVGCGTGRNFRFLRDAVGPEGGIYGIDLSEGMLRRARKLCQRRRWTNFVLIEADAADYANRELFDGVLFSFSYNVMPHHSSVLRQVWKQLRPGGRLVIVDARLPPGLLGKLIRPFAIWLMKHTLLGNPLIRPWQYHAALVDDFHMEDFRFSSYYISCGTKPKLDLADRRLLPASGPPRRNHHSLSQHSRRRPDKLKAASGQRTGINSGEMRNLAANPRVQARALFGRTSQAIASFFTWPGAKDEAP
jgi:demethylmenaquinone methyltransferase/2-methoxy-6-polyprenyl-1,4-benzoquinol methylase